MSDPALERAGGCGLFGSLIVATLLVFSFFIVRQCLPENEEGVVDEVKTGERLEKIKAHKAEEGNFTASIDKAHAELNSNLEEVLLETVQEYNSQRNSTSEDGGEE